MSVSVFSFTRLSSSDLKNTGSSSVLLAVSSLELCWSFVVRTSFVPRVLGGLPPPLFVDEFAVPPFPFGELLAALGFFVSPALIL